MFFLYLKVMKKESLKKNLWESANRLFKLHWSQRTNPTNQRTSGVAFYEQVNVLIEFPVLCGVKENYIEKKVTKYKPLSTENISVKKSLKQSLVFWQNFTFFQGAWRGKEVWRLFVVDCKLTLMKPKHVGLIIKLFFILQVLLES